VVLTFDASKFFEHADVVSVVFRTRFVSMVTMLICEDYVITGATFPTLFFLEEKAKKKIYLTCTKRKISNFRHMLLKRNFFVFTLHPLHFHYKFQKYRM
jgi:citrate lyase synthetase